MDGNLRAKRRRWTLGTLMGVVAALAVALTAFRPYAPATLAATRVLKLYGPKPASGLDTNEYMAVSTNKMPSGYWKVQFVRVAGSGALTQTVMVPDDVVQKSRVSR
jgi:hypothetical protein